MPSFTWLHLQLSHLSCFTFLLPFLPFSHLSYLTFHFSHLTFLLPVLSYLSLTCLTCTPSDVPAWGPEVVGAVRRAGMVDGGAVGGQGVQRVRPGDVVVARCEAGPSHPPANITWTLNHLHDLAGHSRLHHALHTDHHGRHAQMSVSLASVRASVSFFFPFYYIYCFAVFSSSSFSCFFIFSFFLLLFFLFLFFIYSLFCCLCSLSSSFFFLLLFCLFVYLLLFVSFILVSASAFVFFFSLNFLTFPFLPYPTLP